MTLSSIATGSKPFTYQWQVNGANNAGATNATLTLGDLQGTNAGVYSVIISNGAGSVTSVAAQVQVLALPQFTSSVNLGNNQGFQLKFTGPAGYNYSIWTSTNAAAADIKGTWKKLYSGGTFSGETDSYTDPNGGDNTAQFYIISVP